MMKLNRRTVAIALAATPVAALLPSAAWAQKPIVLGFSQVGAESEWRTANTESIKSAAKEAGIKFIVGARLDLLDAPSLLAFPRDRASYGRLCRLLTLGQRRTEKGQCTLYLDDVAAHAEGLTFIALPPEDFPSPCKGEVDSICFTREANAVGWGSDRATHSTDHRRAEPDPHPARFASRPPPFRGRYRVH